MENVQLKMMPAVVGPKHLLLTVLWLKVDSVQACACEKDLCQVDTTFGL